MSNELNTINKLNPEIGKMIKEGKNYRDELIIDLCRGKRVLNIGCLCHSNWEMQIRDGKWLHGRIAEQAKNIIGIDYLEEEVNRLNNLYQYNILYGDAMKLDKFSFDEKFDVIVCGEIIEHLENPGLLLTRLKSIASPHTQLIITTPNPWWLRRMNIFFAKKEQVKLNKEHVMYFSYWTLSTLLIRMGFTEVSWGYYKNGVLPVKLNFRNMVSNILCNITPPELQRGLFFVSRPNEAKGI